jgi:DNA-nicking Smr family endonuclease
MIRRGKGGLSGEDAALWEHVTRNVSRMTARKRANRPSRESPGNEPQPKRAGVVEPLAKPSIQHHLPKPPAAKVRAAAPAGIEPRKAKRVARGRDEIEARIDLHGMRQVEAHGALRGFLARAYANGFRMVLVITGKGREFDEDRHTPFDMFQDRDRGILRRNVPRWLAEPELRSIVVGYTSAHAKHGGDGAFYVQLRNRDKHRG